jgi:peroxiredoxin
MCESRTRSLRGGRAVTGEPGRCRTMLKSGDAAPDFTARDHLGNEVSLAKLRGKTVVLWFFPKADTPG